ncbi:MAG TPA: hypothetical protein VK302_01175 [Terriglobales bacterium]|nr:hypothetical protein [Terriglobales bacterium]
MKRLRLQLAPSPTALGLLLSAVLAVSAQAQQASTPAPSPSVMTDQELAISVHNPFEDFVKVPVQSTTGFEIGPHHKAGDALNIEPVVPLPLTADWDLIARPSLTLAYSPTPHEQSGLEDLETSFFLTPAKNSTWIWGLGPIFDFPTASSSELGSGRWSAGPTVALAYSEGPWSDYILGYQLMSFAGNRERGSVNQTYIEPQISYNFESGWYFDCDPAITYDWTADAANAWTIPMGADVGKAFTIGSHSLSLQGGAYDLLKRPDGAPQWITRVSVTFLFPTGIK